MMFSIDRVYAGTGEKVDENGRREVTIVNVATCYRGEDIDGMSESRELQSRVVSIFLERTRQNSFGVLGPS